MMNTESVGVSVIMPAYNASKTIARAIESVIVQTHAKLELIIIDDCSTDETCVIAESYAAKDDRIRLVRNEVNQGVAKTRNNGINKCQYDWIAFLDSDDYWREDKLRLQLTRIAEDSSLGLCFTGSAFIDDKGNRSEYILHVPSKVSFHELLKQNVISCSSVLVRRELIMETPMCTVDNIHEDYATWLGILKKVKYAMGVDEPLLIYQVSSSSKSGNKFKAAVMQWRTYRTVGIPFFKAAYSFVIYAIRNVSKYRNIAKGTVN